MKVLIVGLVVLALGVAGVSTYLIKSFSSQEALQELEKEAAAIKTRVLVAAKDLRRGDKVAKESVEWRTWPKESLSPQYVVIENDAEMDAKLVAFLDKTLKEPVKAGTPLLQENLFAGGTAGFLAAQIEPGMRAVAVPVTAQTQVAGFIVPGDYVDVLLTHDSVQKLLKDAEKEKKRMENQRRQAEGEGGAEGEAGPETGDPMWYFHNALGPFVFISSTTETILRNVKVLAIDQAVEGGGPEQEGPGGNPQAKTATLQLTPKQAELVTAARSMGSLSLVLRSLGPTDPDESPKTYTTDVDVSPLFARFREEFEARNKSIREAAMARAKALEAERAAEQAQAEAERQAAQSKAPATPAPAKPAARKPVITIYRGGAAESEEVKLK